MCALRLGCVGTSVDGLCVLPHPLNPLLQQEQGIVQMGYRIEDHQLSETSPSPMGEGD